MTSKLLLDGLASPLANQLLDAIRHGVPWETASTQLGLNHSAITDWMHAASGSWRSGSPVSPAAHAAAVAFSVKVRQAQADWEARQIQGISDAAEAVNERTGLRDWRARAWLLNNHPTTRRTYHELKETEEQRQVTIRLEHEQVRKIADQGLDVLEASFQAFQQKNNLQ